MGVLQGMTANKGLNMEDGNYVNYWGGLNGWFLEEQIDILFIQLLRAFLLRFSFPGKTSLLDVQRKPRQHSYFLLLVLAHFQTEIRKMLFKTKLFLILLRLFKTFFNLLRPFIYFFFLCVNSAKQFYLKCNFEENSILIRFAYLKMRKEECCSRRVGDWKVVVVVGRTEVQESGCYLLFLSPLPLPSIFRKRDDRSEKGFHSLSA